MTRPEMEFRRLSAALDLKAGLKVIAVAKKWGVSRMTAHRWKKELRHGYSLARRKPTGRPSKLTPKQQHDLQAAYLAELGKGQRWTNTSLQAFIYRVYRIQFQHDYCCRILQKLRREQL